MLRRLLLITTTIIAALAGTVALQKIAQKIVLYVAGLHGPDAQLYWIMGNAIRNNLTIYTDIFDPKPPGMFLLSAFSFSLFEDGRIGAWLSIIILLGIPLLFLWWAYTRRKKAGASFDALQLALMFGLVFTLYNATIGGDWQTEFYGAFCGLLYVAGIDSYQRKQSIPAIVLACLGFGVALLLKEPFLLALAAVAVLLLHTRQEWIRLFLYPLLSACALYAVALTALGAFTSYIGTYLPGMLGGYILRGGTGPVWARGVAAWERIWTNVLDFNGAFPLLIFTLVILAIPRSSGKRETAFRLSMLITGIGVLLVGRSFSPVPLPWHLGLAPSALVLLIGIAGMLASTPLRRMLSFLRTLWRPLFAVYLTFTAIGLGSDFHGQYFALAIPVYGAFFVAMLDRLQARPATERAYLTASVTILASIILITSTPYVPRGSTLTMQVRQLHENEQHDRNTASAVDAILSACQVDRYYFLEDREYAPYTLHSPLNYYLYSRIEHIPRYHPIFHQPSFDALEATQIIVLGKPYAPAPRAGNTEETAIGNRVTQFLEDNFTQEPWPCAEGLPEPEGYFLLFRNGDMRLET